MKMTRTVGVLALLLPISHSALATQAWHAAGLEGSVVTLPGGCTTTWYDPEAFAYPDGSHGFLAQGAMANPCTANVGLDSLFRAKYDSASLSWQLPAANSCPTLTGIYSSAACPGQEFFAPNQPLASPAIVRVGTKYYMAFSGGNGDYRKGHVFWASSNDGVNWTTFKWDPKPAGYSWRPLIYPKYGDFCETFGIPQLTLSYDPSTEYGPQGAFYIHFNYLHRTGEFDTYAIRFRYSDANGFGFGGGTQICLNSGPRGIPCMWVDHSGVMVFDYDGQPAEPNDPVLARGGGNKRNFGYGAGSLAWDPSHGNWLRVFLGSGLQWQTSTSLSSGIWSAPKAVEMTPFHDQVKALYPSYVQNEVYYGGLWWGKVGSRTGMWLFQPADYRGCSSVFRGLGIFTVALDFSSSPLDFYTVVPCRVLDTRTDGGSLIPGQPRSIAVAGKCDIPADAGAVSLNLTAIAPISGGYITLYPGGAVLPPTTTISFDSGKTQANNAIIALANDGTGSLAGQAVLESGSQIDIVVDINGYFK
jgi:hypothetical protein